MVVVKKSAITAMERDIILVIIAVEKDIIRVITVPEKAL
jgi:hypothetical protein